MRTGSDYLRDISEPRAVFVDGESVEVVPEHPAFRQAARTIARLYDVAADPASGMTADVDGRHVNRALAIPRSLEDLAARRSAIACWARESAGFLGRGPDHVAGFLAGFASAAELFDRERRAFGANVCRFYERVLDESLYVSYTILPPQFDRSTSAGGWDDLIQVGVVDENERGIVVRGSQALGTGAPFSDYVFVSCIKPLRAGDEAFANSFVVPVGSPGLKLICRRPYATSIPSAFDYPLSARFDESDCFAVFDDVFVPWEDVFVFAEPEMLRRQFFGTPAHVLGNSQAQIRLATKLKFILGIARKIVAVNRVDGLPPVQEKLGELAALASVVEGMTIAAEAGAEIDERGVAVPNPRFLYGVMALQSELYPRAIQIVRELSGVGVMQLPSSRADFDSEDIGDDIRRYIRSPDVPAEERVKLFKLAWDVVGSEFAGRHQQYEMFFAGAPFITRGYAFRNYGFQEPLAEVETFLDSYGLDSDPVAPVATSITEGGLDA